MFNFLTPAVGFRILEFCDPRMRQVWGLMVSGVRAMVGGSLGFRA